MTYGHAPNIGLIGRKRTGKDTAALHLIETYGFTKYAFADGVRDLATALDPVVFPAPPTSARGEACRYGEALERVGYERAKDLFPELRRVLQGIGQGVRDLIGEDAWVDALERKLAGATGPVVVTDCRYPNEVDRLKSLGFVLVKLDRPSYVDPDDDHPSEVLTDSLTADWTFTNESDDGEPYAPMEAFQGFLDGVVLTGSSR